MSIFKRRRRKKVRERTGERGMKGRENMLSYGSLVRLRITSLGRLVNIILNHNSDRESDYVV